MDDSELAAWYSPPGDDESFKAEIGRQKLHWFAHQTEEILVLRQLCAAAVPVVLDFGCNWGKWASMALAHGCEVYGVEVNRQAAAFCARRGIQMVSAEQLAELRFDFINVDQVMEHLSDPLKVEQQLSRCLKPGGFLKMSTPNNPRLPRQLARAQRTGDNGVLAPQVLDSLLPLEHVNLFNEHSLRNLARAVGLANFRLPLFIWFGAGQLWNVPRQLNRNLLVPFKRWRGRGSYQWFRKPGKEITAPESIPLNPRHGWLGWWPQGGCRAVLDPENARIPAFLSEEAGQLPEGERVLDASAGSRPYAPLLSPEIRVV